MNAQGQGQHTEQRSQFPGNDEDIGVNKVLTYSFPAHLRCLLTNNNRYIDKDSPQAPISMSSESLEHLGKTRAGMISLSRDYTPKTLDIAVDQHQTPQ
jgi:hypothetical protein